MAKELTDLAITRESLYGMTEEPTYSGITSFLRRRYTRDLTGVDVAVTGVPYDLATTQPPWHATGTQGNSRRIHHYGLGRRCGRVELRPVQRPRGC